MEKANGETIRLLYRHRPMRSMPRLRSGVQIMERRRTGNKMEKSPGCLAAGDFRKLPIRPFPIPACIVKSAACVQICPEKAISKRTEDGIVVVNRRKCVGCRSCAKACPFHIPQYGKAGVMQKCDLCLERLGQGKLPSCVATCPGEALKFGTLEDLTKMSAANVAHRLSAVTAPAFFISGKMTGMDFLALLNSDK